MYGNPYWSAMMPMMPQYMQPPVQQPQVIQQNTQQPIQQTLPQAQTQTQQIPSNSNTWNWKVVANYQAMLMESIPFDGTPVLFMLQNESTFYVVNMVDGHKMVNGYSFIPLDQGKTTTDQKKVATISDNTTEDRISKLEENVTTLIGQLNKLVGGQNNESNNDSSKIKRQPITAS